MKRILFLLSFLFAVPAWAQLPTSGLLAWYPFCGNALDRSGNTRHLSVSGPTLTSDRFGMTGAAYYYNGSTATLANALHRTPPMPTDAGNFTYAVWFYTDTGGNNVIVANGDNNINGYQIVTLGHNVAAVFGGISVMASSFISYHQWHHAVLRRNGSTYNLIVDTVNVATFSGTFNSSPTSQKFATGQDYTDGSNSFTGKIDDIAVYNRALSDTEIRQLYHFNPNVSFSLGTDTFVCFPTVTLQPNTNYTGSTYLWSNGSTDSSITVGSGGTYWLSITQPYGCAATDTQRLTIGSTDITLGRDTSICSGSSYTLALGLPGGAAVLWSTGATSTSISISSAGTYWVTVNDSGCITSDTMVLSLRPAPIAFLGPDTIICTGTLYTLRPSIVDSSAHYLWSTGDTTFTLTTGIAGSYTLTVTDSGCTSRDSARVTVVPRPVVNLGRDTILCFASSLLLTSVQPIGSQYHWSTGSVSNSVNITTSGIYWLTVRTGGCISSDTLNVSFSSVPSVNLGPDIEFCEGQAAILQSSATYSSPAYLWSTGATSPAITVSTAGIYTLTVTQAGCSGSDVINVTVKPLPVVDLGTGYFLCDGSVVNLTTPQPSSATYLWSTGSTSATITVNSPGIYGVVVTDNGCIGSDTVEVSKIAPPRVDIGPDTTLCEGYVLNLLVNAERATYLWSTGSTSANEQIDGPGTYWVTIANGCGTVADTINVQYRTCDLWLPVAFSPNGDGKNETVRLRGSLFNITAYSFAIYNRWGQRVFLTENINEGWDGTFNNTPQEIGNYYYMINYTINGRKNIMKGNILLLK